MLITVRERLRATDTDIRGSRENPCSSALGTWRQHKEQTLDRAIKLFNLRFISTSRATLSHAHTKSRFPKFSCSLLFKKVKAITCIEAASVLKEQ